VEDVVMRACRIALIALLGLLSLSSGGAAGAEVDKERAKYRAAWAEWWKRHGDAVDLDKFEPSPQWRGHVLAVCFGGAGMRRRGMGGRGGAGRVGAVRELDGRGHVRWEIADLSMPVDAQVINNNRILVTEYSPGQVTERNTKGEILRRINVPNLLLQARRLPNGHTVITTRTRVFELDRHDKEVWAANATRATGIVAACPLSGGEIGICYRDGEFVRLDRNGKVRASFQIGRMFRPYGTHIQGLPNGHVLVPQYYEGKVVEFDKNGREVWSASSARPTSAQRLPNGRTLVASFGNNSFAELDKDGGEVKSQRCDGPLMCVSGR
jgi:hypothetical protein